MNYILRHKVNRSETPQKSDGKQGKQIVVRAQNRNSECKQTQNSAKRGRNGTVKRKKKECMRQKKKELRTHRRTNGLRVWG